MIDNASWHFLGRELPTLTFRNSRFGMYNRVTWRTYQGHGIESRGQRSDLDKFFPSLNGMHIFLDNLSLITVLAEF